MGINQDIDITAEQRKTVLALLQRHLPNTAAWVYGSRAQWTSRPQSDFDLVVFATPEQNSRVSDLREAFEESNLPFRVDLFVWDEVPEQFRKQIEAEHAVLVEREERVVGGGWREVPAENFCESVRDGTHDSPKPVKDGRYLITSRHIIGDRVDLSNAYRISEADFDEVNRRSEVYQWDVLITMIGTVGDICLIREKPNFAIKNIGLFKSKGEIEGKWLYYYLKSPKAKALIESLKRGTTQAYIPLGELRRLPIRYPQNRSVAENIVFVLSSLDEKIELNRRMNETLEEMARALFKSWFVDFDPVRAKAALITPPPEGSDWTVERARAYLPAARGLAQAGLAGMDDSIADLFPDQLVDSELGPIPEGWEVGVLDDAIEILSGGTPRTSVPNYWEGDIPWYTAKDAPSLSDVFVLDTERAITQAGVENSATKILPFGTTIITARGTVGRLACLGVPMAMNQTCYGIRGARGYPDFFTYWTVRKTVDELQSRTHGTIFDTITRQTFNLVETALPPAELAEAFELTVTPVMGRILCNLLESRTLAALRDLLLPKLVSGELRLGEAFIHEVSKPRRLTITQ